MPRTGVNTPSMKNTPVTSVLNSVRKNPSRRNRANLGVKKNGLFDRKASLDLNKLAEEKFKELEQEEEQNRQNNKLDSNSLANSMIHNIVESPIKANVRPTLQTGKY